MDVEINAGGRYVKVTGVEDTDTAFKLWEQVKQLTPDPKPMAAIGFRDDIDRQHDHDRGYGTNSGHRPVIR